MFYKKENDSWLIANIVRFPDGTEISKDDKQNLHGWEWHDTPPEDYLTWKSEQLNEI